MAAVVPYAGTPGRPTGCDFSPPLTLNTFLQVVVGIREDLACGALTDEGTQYLDGVKTLKLVSVTTFRTSPTRVATLTATMWVDPATYLPVRWALGSTSPMLRGGTTDIRWLPPTRANQALLKVSIPSGFTQAPPRSS